MRTDVVTFTTTDGWSAPLPSWDSPQTVVMAFACPRYRENPAPLKELAEVYPQSTVIGCSTAGQIAGEHVVDEAIVVLLIEFDHTPLRSVLIEDVGESRHAGESLASALDGEDLAGVFVLAEGLEINGSALAEGMASVLGDRVPVTGGLAGDGADFNETWLFADGRVIRRGIVGIGFYGDAVGFGHGSQGGWDIFGPERRVTRSEENVLFELDGQSALTLYREYLGDLADGLPANGLLFPLAINRDPDPPLVRTLLAIDDEADSITFAGNVPEGSMVRLMRAHFDRLVDGAENAASLARTSDVPVALIAISCVGRRLVLRDRVDEETEATLSHFPAGTKQAGFYSYGELSPFGPGTCELYNQTMTLTSLWEREDGVV